MRTGSPLSWAAGHFLLAAQESIYGEDSFEEILNDQEEDSFETVSQVTKQDSVEEVCQGERHDCVPKTFQDTCN